MPPCRSLEPRFLLDLAWNEACANFLGYNPRMEAAAAGIAVVSLTLQVAHTVRTSYEFFRSVKGAPKELDRLLDLLEELNDAFDDAKSVLEKHGAEEVSLLVPAPRMCRTLQRCERALIPLQELVKKLGAALQKPNTTGSKAWASVVLALKKKDVETIEERLRQALAALQRGLILKIQLGKRYQNCRSDD